MRAASSQLRRANTGWKRQSLPLAVLCSMLSLAECAPEQKTVRYKPFFSGLDGMETQTPPVYEKDVAVAGKDGAPGTLEESLVVITPDGKKRLLSRTGAQ